VNGAGQYTITNNYLEAAGENVLFGGDDPKIPGLVQSQIVFTDNVVSRPMAWKGGSWSIKNLFELKLAEHVDIERNTFENHWPQAQKGVAILFTPRDQYGTAPQTVVGDVTFRGNVVRNVASAIEILGRDNVHPSQQTHDIVIDHNVVEVASKTLGGDGRFLNLDDGSLDGALNVSVTNNTVKHDGSSLVYVSGSHTWRGFVYEANLSLHNSYGIMSSKGIGNPTLAFYFPAARIVSNVLAGANAKLYPAGTLTPTVAAFEASFVNWSGGDLAQTSTSPYADLGAK
jgi:hypothetical protein